MAFFVHLLLLLPLFLSDGASSEKVCSYQDVLDHLNLTRANEVYTSTRPVLDHTHRTLVNLDISLYAILAVIEKTQTFIPFIWILLKWKDERISWDPAQFCGITKVSLPKEMLWKPDLFIYEMTEMDKASKCPYIHVSHEGIVTMEDDLKVISTCRMDVHKFPFDTQSCNISISSAIHTIHELQLLPFSNSSRVTQFSRQIMRTQGEWEFLNLSVTSVVLSINREDWETIVYTITMKRRPLLHVINFLLPVLFFLCLDLSSFLISDHRGEKLGFKVTVLLAISVLLLILNDILPSMSNRTPLIATYCIVIFALMLLSLLETVLVMHLMEKDPLTEKNERTRERGVADDCERERDKGSPLHSEENRQSRDCVCACTVSGGHAPCGRHASTEQGESPHGGRCNVLPMILEELREMKALALSRGSRDEGATSGYWSRVAARIHKVFFVFYVTTAVLFLTLMYKGWHS